MSKRHEKAQPEEVQRELTRKEQLLRHRDRERHKKLYTFVGIALGLAIALVVIGVGYQFLVMPNMAAAKVGDVSISTQQFWKRAKFEKSSLQGQLSRYQQLEQQFGGQGFFQTQIDQIQTTLASPFAVGQQTLDNMIEEILVAKEAEKRGITVTDADVDAALREEVANGQGLVTESQAVATAEANANATATAASWTPTPMPTVDANAVVTATATATATPAIAPPPVVITETTFTEGVATLEKNLQAVSGLSLVEYKQIIRNRLLRDKVSTAIGEEKVIPTEEQVHARHILLRVREPAATDIVTPTLEATTANTVTTTAPVTATDKVTATNPVTTTAAVTATNKVTTTAAVSDTVAATPSTAPRSDAETLALAQELRKRILAGEDFATLAKQYSDDTGSGSNGGDLGWFVKGAMVAAFEDVAFALPVGQVSEPVKTDFGYHLIEVIEKDTQRPKDEATLNQDRIQAFDQWIQEQLSAGGIERPGDLNALLPAGL